MAALSQTHVPDWEPPADVPDGDAEHAIEVGKNVRAPLLVAMDEDLGVGLRAKLMPVLLEFGPEASETRGEFPIPEDRRVVERTRLAAQSHQVMSRLKYHRMFS